MVNFFSHKDKGYNLKGLDVSSLVSGNV